MEVDLDSVAIASKGLSGGGILNLCVNSIFNGSAHPHPAKWIVTDLMLMMRWGA